MNDELLDPVTGLGDEDEVIGDEVRLPGTDDEDDKDGGDDGEEVAEESI